MNINRTLLFFLISFMMSFLLPNYAVEAATPQCVDHTLEDYGTKPYMDALVTPSTPDTSKIKVCHRTASATNPYVIITISQSAVADKGHKSRHATCSGKKHPDYFWSPITKCPGETMTAPIPTVKTSPALKFQDTVSPVLTGTIGTTTLQKSGSETETFSVTVNGTTYQKGTVVGTVIITGTAWSLTLPAPITFYPDTDAMLFSKKYEVVATRNPGYEGNADFVEMDDETEMELEIFHNCSNGAAPVGGVCPTTCTAPKTGTPPSCSCPTTMFTNSLGTCEAKPVCSGSTPNYNNLTNLCEITPTSSNPTVNVIDGQTYTSPTAIETRNQLPVILGKVGTTVLAANDTFSVKVTSGTTSYTYNYTYNQTDAALRIDDGLNWTLTIPADDKLPIGTYEIEAAKNTSNKDSTSNELKIYVAICNNQQNEKVYDLNDWEGTKEGVNYYLGSCGENTHSLATKPNPFPDTPQGLTPQATPEENPYCDDGGKRSNVTVRGVTIKRATIINASTDNASVTSSLVDKFLKYGEKTSAVGTINIASALIDKNSATGATLTGVELNNAVIDIDMNGEAFDRNTGVFTPSNIFINATGGSTYPSESSPKPVSTIINGVITAGTDANNQPIRGSVTSGRYTTNATPSYTKSRRITGKLVNATITNARIVTINGKTVVDSGTITAGTIEGTVSAFGTAQNAVVTGAELSETTHCFSSGTVGNKGQLNWKEVVK